MSTHNSELKITSFPKGSPTEPKNPAQLYGELYPVTSPDTIHSMQAVLSPVVERFDLRRKVNLALPQLTHGIANLKFQI